MIYSEKYRLIFVASPKTGTVTVQALLQEILPDARKNRVVKGDELIKIFGHAKANDIRESIGRAYYDEHESIAFVRNPYAKLVSSYFFYRGHKQVWEPRQDIKLKVKINTAARILFARFVPFKLWAVLYPYKSNNEYLLDKQGNLIVKHIGRTEFLEQDLKAILKTLGIAVTNLEVGRKNTSKHGAFMDYYQTPWFKKIMDNKLAEDIAFYHKVAERF